MVRDVFIFYMQIILGEKSWARILYICRDVTRLDHAEAFFRHYPIRPKDASRIYAEKRRRTPLLSCQTPTHRSPILAVPTGISVAQG